MKQKVNKTTQPIRSQSDRDALASYFWNHNLRDYAFFYFGIYTGRRISDIVRMNVRDVAEIDRKSHFVIRERLARTFGNSGEKNGKIHGHNPSPDNQTCFE